MKTSRLLIIEDDPDTAEVLRSYFTQKGLDVRTAGTGHAGLESCRERLPDLVLLNLRLPDMPGLDVCQALRAGARTGHIPIIIISQVGDQATRLRALELGADDYLVKPFDMDELGLRVSNTLRRMQQESLTDPRSDLPAERLCKEHMRKLMRAKNWACLGLRINEFGTFAEMYPYPAGDLVVRAIARLITNTVNEIGTPDDFVGQAGEVFVIITTRDRGAALRDALVERFGAEIGMHYDFQDRQRGYMVVRGSGAEERHAPLMSLAVKLVTDEDDPGDIRDII